MTAATHITLILPLGLGYGRGIARGVMAYSKPSRGWIFSLNDPHGTATVAGLRSAPPDGVIAHVNTESLAGALLKMGCPVVNTSNAMAGLPFLQMRLDNPAIGEMGARHFLDRGFREFAFYGGKAAFFEGRQRGYLDTLAAAGIPPEHVCCWHEGEPDLQTRLVECPKPVAVFAPAGAESWYFSELCRNAGVRVPEEAALLSVDNDELFCELAYPKLSSIRLPLQRLGYEAAAALERLLTGETPAPPPVVLKPVDVVTRHSTDVMAVEDAEVAAALRHIKANCHRPLKVESVLRELNVSRRSLEYKFRKELGRTPLQEIHRLQVERARVLLTSTDQPVRAVAHECGFSNPVQFWSVFKKMEGISPHAFRARSRSVEGRGGM
jgi:LacI family transcriptional regulator